MSARTQSSAESIGAYLDAVIRRDPSAVDRYFDPNVEYIVNDTPFQDPAGCCLPFLQNATALFLGSAFITVRTLSRVLVWPELPRGCLGRGIQIDSTKCSCPVPSYRVQNMGHAHWGAGPQCGGKSTDYSVL